MPTDIFKVVSYLKENGKVVSIKTIYRGNYDNCLKFYSKNKAAYREENKFLEVVVRSDGNTLYKRDKKREEKIK